MSTYGENEHHNHIGNPAQGKGEPQNPNHAGGVWTSGGVACRVVWEAEPVTITANQALAAEADGTEHRSAKAEAEAFLREILANGPVPATGRGLPRNFTTTE
jgi:hypothetical protein